jgi:hypothetical protein
MSGVRDPLPDPRARTSSAWLPLQSSRTGLGSRTLLSWARSNLIPTDVRLRRPLPGASFRRSLRADGATRLPRSAFAVSHCLDGFLHLRVAGLLRPAAGRMFGAFCRRPPPGGIAPFGSGRRRLATRTPFEELSSSTAAPRHRGPCLPAVTFRPDEYRSGEALRPLAPGPRERLGAIGLSAGGPCWESACAVLLRSLSRAGVLASSGVAAFGVGSGPARLTPIDRLRCAAVSSPCGGIHSRWDGGSGPSGPVVVRSRALRGSRAPRPAPAALRWGRFKAVVPTRAETGSVRVRGSGGSGVALGMVRGPPAGHAAPAGLAGSREGRVSELSLRVPVSISTVHLRSHRTGLALRAARGHHGRRRSGGASVSAPSARSGSRQGGSVAVGGRSEGGSRDLRSRGGHPVGSGLACARFLDDPCS